MVTGVAARLRDFGHRRVVMPLMAQIKQGSSPRELASSLAWGGALALFPLIGTTTLLCALAGHLLKLNHVALQLMNYILFPLHLVLIIPFLKIGDWVFARSEVAYTMTALADAFEASPRTFVVEYGASIMRGCAVWALIMPLPAFVFRVLVQRWLANLSAKIERFQKNRSQKIDGAS